MATAPVTTGAPTRAPSIPALHRRRFLGALALAPIATLPIAFPASPAASRVVTAIAANQAAEARFNALPGHLEESDPDLFAQEEERMSVAWGFACEQIPVTWGEYVALFEMMTSRGTFGLDDDRAASMLGHAQRLLAGGQA